MFTAEAAKRRASTDGRTIFWHNHSLGTSQIMTFEIGAFLFLLLRPRHENKATRGGGGKGKRGKPIPAHSPVPARRRKRLSRSRLVERHSSPLQVWSRQTLVRHGRLGDIGETNPHSSSGRTRYARSRRRGSIDATHMHIWRDKMIGGDNLCLWVTRSRERGYSWCKDFLRARRTWESSFSLVTGEGK